MAATTTFKKNFFKLLINAVFGKTMENVRHQRNITFVDSTKKAEKLIALPTFKNVTVFRQDLIAVERRKCIVHMNKPIYSGFTILDNSKIVMYKFHYQFMKKLYPGDKLKLCFTDTDSFLYKIKTKDFHADMVANHELFDFSNYSSSHPCFSHLSASEIEHLRSKNKKVIGKFKDEMGGDEMLEFVGLRAKVYAFRSSKAETKKLKGIKTAVVDNEVTFNNYKNIQINQSQMRHSMNTFISKEHQVQSVTKTKVSLSCFDDKRYIREDGIETFAHGHYRIV